MVLKNQLELPELVKVFVGDNELTFQILFNQLQLLKVQNLLLQFGVSKDEFQNLEVSPEISSWLS